MTPAMKEAQLKAARRDQHFTNVPLGRGQCALRASEVAVFPVRYALDESPLDKASPQGPHPLPKGWQHAMPTLKTRSYTLRQLRDGWLYVWNSIDETFHEYQVSGENFIRHKWTQALLNQDKRENPGEPHPYLLYPRRSQLRIAYSPVQWTWRMCELMRSNEIQQARWMRHVDLPAYCANGTLEHGAPITELGKSVADILVCDEPEDNAPHFTSTRLPTRPNEAGDIYKPAFEEPLVRGRVPEQDTALFVALDDPLALVDDLAMNLAGRLLERSLFDAEHGQRLQSALAVQSLCGIDVEPLIPADIKDDPYQRQRYINDLYDLLQVHDQVARAQDLTPSHQAPAIDLIAVHTIDAAEAPFKQAWGDLPDRKLWRPALDQWRAKQLWREDVHFDQVCHYLKQAATEAGRLESHCLRSEADLLAWLDRLDPSAEVLYHDTCQVKQSSDLLKTTHMLYTLLGNGKQGQQWLRKQAERPSSLFGMALFNFDPELEQLINQVTENFSTTGSLDGQGRQGDGHSPALDLSSSGDATNLATRANEFKGVLDLDSVRNSKLYQALSGARQQSFDTLISVANDKAGSAWHGLGNLLLAGIEPQRALRISAVHVLVSREIASSVQLLINPHYTRDFQNWLQAIKTLSNRIAGDMRVLQHPGPLHDKRAARRSIQAREAQLKKVFLERPNLITGRVVTNHVHLNVEIHQVQGWLHNLGQAEVAEQQKVFGDKAYWDRTKGWMERNIGQALPAIVVGLNLWNLSSSAEKARNDGHFTPDEWRIVSANAAYAANAVMALWVGPAWNRAGAMTAKVGREMLKLAQAGYTAWLNQARSAVLGSPQAALANEFATASKGLILRTVTWATLGAVAAGLEAWQVFKDIDKATSEEEHMLLWIKFGVVFGMSIIAIGQLIGSGLGYWFAFSWVMSTPVMIIVALFGIAYLIVSMLANRYKREGLRLWLHRCQWGRNAAPLPLSEEGYKDELRILQENLQRPIVLGKSLRHPGVEDDVHYLGFWVQIQVPITLAGKTMSLQPAVIQTRTLARNELQPMPGSFYDQFLDGHWIDPEQLGQLPALPGNRVRQVDFIHTGKEKYRLWQAWIETPVADPVLELRIRYPVGTLQLKLGRAYVFRLAMGRDTDEADRLDNIFDGKLNDDDDVVLAHSPTQPLELIVPPRVAHDS